MSTNLRAATGFLLQADNLSHGETPERDVPRAMSFEALPGEQRESRRFLDEGLNL
jgi:hypothetical protein